MWLNFFEMMLSFVTWLVSWVVSLGVPLFRQITSDDFWKFHCLSGCNGQCFVFLGSVWYVLLYRTTKTSNHITFFSCLFGNQQTTQNTARSLIIKHILIFYLSLLSQSFIYVYLLYLYGSNSRNFLFFLIYFPIISYFSLFPYFICF